MSKPFDFSDFPDLKASYAAAGDAIRALTYFQTDLNNLFLHLSEPARDSTADPCETGKLLVRDARPAVAGFLALHQHALPQCMDAIVAHVYPLLEDFAAVSRREGSAAAALYGTVHKLRLHLDNGGRAGIPHVITSHVPEAWDVLKNAGWHIRPLVERCAVAKARPLEPGTSAEGPAKTVSEVEARLRVLPDFQKQVSESVLTNRIQNVLLFQHEYLGKKALDSMVRGITSEHAQVAAERRRAKRKSDAMGPAGKRRKTRKPKREPVKSRPLTAKQAEAVHIVGECKGNMVEAAQRLGIDRKSVADRYNAAMRKMGRTVVRHVTQSLPSDRRGQANLSPADDLRR